MSAAMNATDANVPLLEVIHIAGGYGDLQVLWDISLTVKPGTISLLLGRNGVGKTTTLRVIAGLNRATSGEIRLKGSEITWPDFGAARPTGHQLRSGGQANLSAAHR